MHELKKSFWDFVFVLSSSFISIPLMIFSESIQARYLGPEKYGQVALIISAIALLYIFGLNWLRLAILRFGKEEFIKEGHLRRTTTNFVLLSFFSFWIVITLFHIFQESIFGFLEINEQYYFWIIALGLILTAGKTYIFEILKVIRKIKEQSFLMRFATKIFIALGILLIILKILEIKIINIIFIFLISDLLIVIIGLLLINKKYLIPFDLNKKLLYKMFIFSFPLLFASWSNYIITWIDTYVIKYFLTLEDVGIYQASYKIFNTIRSFLFSSIVTISTPIILVFRTKDQTYKISEFYLKRLLPQVSFFVFILVTFSILFSDLGFHLVYGHKFDASILPFKIIITTLHLGLISAFFTAIRVSFDMTKMYLYLGIFAAVLNFALDIYLVPIFGILGAAAATFLVFTINPVIWYFIINRKFAVKRKLALLFPLFSFAVLFINIYFSSFILRIIGSMILITISFLISRKFNLFHESDINLLDQIQIPKFFKDFYRKLIKISNK
ncbi:MAG: oligosaccharide flippase family protein [Candidatus Cloacimonetes bacterium]|nr:oligosaccharide flippase family protein [Candidatus Cloacimonadota bacterium]MCF7868671.1 oligosaccharide flippase family protein [Candidatus Cloacimonadota bacterium]